MTILGGRTATENPRYWLEACPNVDAVVCGDGEQTMAEIAQGRPWSEIAGLAHRGPDGQVVFTRPRANVPLDDNLMPARELAPPCLLPDQQGREHGDQGRPGRRLAGLPVQLQVLQLLHQPVGRETVLDAALAASRSSARSSRSTPTWSCSSTTCSRYQPDRVVAICDLLIAKGIRKHYIVNARLEIANRPDVLAKMEQAGFIALLVGVESTQDATLKSMGKGFTIEQVRERFEVLRKSKMIINAYFIVGNIGETEEQMFSTAPFARSIGVDLIHVSRLRNEPYSGLARTGREDARLPHRRRRLCLQRRLLGRAHRQSAQADRSAVPHSLQVARVVMKLARVLTWRVKAKAVLTIPIFLTLLIATQIGRKVA